MLIVLLTGLASYFAWRLFRLETQTCFYSSGRANPWEPECGPVNYRLAPLGLPVLGLVNLVGGYLVAALVNGWVPFKGAAKHKTADDIEGPRAAEAPSRAVPPKS